MLGRLRQLIAPRTHHRLLASFCNVRDPDKPTLAQIAVTGNTATVVYHRLESEGKTYRGITGLCEWQSFVCAVHQGPSASSFVPGLLILDPSERFAVVGEIVCSAPPAAEQLALRQAAAEEPQACGSPEECDPQENNTVTISTTVNEVPEPEPEPNNPNACTITGTQGKDNLVGTSGRDVICGLDGNDNISGRGGNDVIRGGGGNDKISGGGSKDTLLGGTGNDRIVGGAGDDRLEGGAGNDSLVGGPGRDSLKGGSGKNRLVQ